MLTRRGWVALVGGMAAYAVAFGFGAAALVPLALALTIGPFAAAGVLRRHRHAAVRLSVAFDQLLPALRDAMRSHLDRTTSVADAPVRRLLRIAITDVTEDLESAADAVRAVLGLPGEREGADRVRADLMSAGVSFDPLFRA